ncbi:MAG: hypothetical protein QW177_01845, partial [Candidatus Nitrosotenuis sp.]
PQNGNAADDCNRKTRLCVGSAKTRLMATDETEKQQKQNPEPFRVVSMSDSLRYFPNLLNSAKSAESCISGFAPDKIL